jgi:hypothetical protein
MSLIRVRLVPPPLGAAAGREAAVDARAPAPAPPPLPLPPTAPSPPLPPPLPPPATKPPCLDGAAVETGVAIVDRCTGGARSAASRARAGTPHSGIAPIPDAERPSAAAPPAVLPVALDRAVSALVDADIVETYEEPQCSSTNRIFESIDSEPVLHFIGARVKKTGVLKLWDNWIQLVTAPPLSLPKSPRRLIVPGLRNDSVPNHLRDVNAACSARAAAEAPLSFVRCTIASDGPGCSSTSCF